MKYKISVLLAFFMLSGIARAQIIDDSSIQDIQNGGYTVVEGMFVAYLADTVSPGYINKQFQQLDIVILDEYIKPMTISLVNSPSKKRSEKLRNQPKLRAIFTAVPNNEQLSLEAFLATSSFSESQKEDIRERAEEVETYFIELDYSIDRKALKTLMGEFRDVAYKIISDQPRTVTLQAEPGNEPLLMDKVQQLHFVVNCIVR